MLSRRRRGCTAKIAELLTASILCCGCSGSESSDPVQTTDASAEASAEASVDAGTDASVDGTVEAGVDAGTDASGEASVDAGTDASVDGTVEASVDAGTDAALDANVEAGVDGQPPLDSGIVYGIAGQSCEGMMVSCQGKSCCSSLAVPGGTFQMGRGDVGEDACQAWMSCGSSETPEHDVTVSDFLLDEYEVTVGRFRKFVEHFDGTPPPDGLAEHPLIAGSGWQSAWNTSLASSQAELMSNLKCKPGYETWRDAPGMTELRPINCVSWFEAFAFCAWDGGRLPTEAEWEYAAAGGDEDRLFPWGSVPVSKTIAAYDCLFDGKMNCTFEDIAPVGSLPAGAGRWEHKDLGGNMQEWALDWYDLHWYSDGGATCVDCANLTETNGRVYRGGSFGDFPNSLRAARRGHISPTFREFGFGFRCARIP